MTWDGAAAWQASLGLARDAVRQELVARQLHAHLPPAPARVLDAGCGQGTQLIRLARLGYQVVGLDPAADLLAAARAALEAAPEHVRDRVTLRQGELADLGEDDFDAVCCHGVLMYLPSLGESVAALAGAVRPGGVVSVLTRNRAGIAMRAGMAGDWAGALAGFDARTYTNRLGIAGVRADEPEEVAAALAAAGVDVAAWYGVRLFIDHWGDVRPPDDLEAIVAAEAEAGRRDPYRRLAALTHTVGVRAGSRRRRVENR